MVQIQGHKHVHPGHQVASKDNMSPAILEKKDIASEMNFFQPC